MKLPSETIQGYYVNEGLQFDFVNRYESFQNPNTLHLTNTWDYRIWYRRFLERLYSLIIFDGVPKEWKKEYYLPALYLYGNFAVVNISPYGVIPQHGTFYGYNIFYMPTNYLITNPCLKETLDAKIDVDCVVVHLTNDWCGVGDLINTYAQRVSLLLSDVDVASAMSKFGKIFVAKNKALSETFKTVFDDIMSGKLAVVTNQALYDKTTGKELFTDLNNDVEKSIRVVTEALNNIVAIKNDFDREIGLYSAPEKKERLITDEVASTQNAVMSRCEMWVETLNECWTKVNEMFGLDIHCRLRYPNDRGGENNESESTSSSAI